MIVLHLTRHDTRSSIQWGKDKALPTPRRSHEVCLQRMTFPPLEIEISWILTTNSINHGTDHLPICVGALYHEVCARKSQLLESWQRWIHKGMSHSFLVLNRTRYLDAMAMILDTWLTLQHSQFQVQHQDIGPRNENVNDWPSRIKIYRCAFVNCISNKCDVAFKPTWCLRLKLSYTL